ncbi:putative deoxyribonuclease RhsC [Andreprevotia sp. IGB-42]|uniref:RHS repeat-associated core domain-containing protein n=1 Tax=Andreprevotia sp. IGB-42 TaxID=2497473 RepID=UPI00157ECFD9|nr:RHS repeat-associated core domain-containing protein [Andreprevotia sp. IGB-42]KAF0811258.1 putative deoxyribonuclease RhsC [Andreprevotia sp. IGB-42]
MWADQLGTPRQITDPANNQLVWRWDSEAFGNTQANQDPGNTGNQFVYNLRFPGQYYDAESGRHYNYFRDYDPTTGRYVQSDPIGLNGGSFSTYAYVGGNPLSLSDPLGLATKQDIDCVLNLLKEVYPDLYPNPPTSVIGVPGLSTWYGKDLQGYTDTKNNIQYSADLYEKDGTPVYSSMFKPFIQTISHEMTHAQDGTLKKMFSHGELHDAIDSNAAIIAEQWWQELVKRRNKGECGCGK